MQQRADPLGHRTAADSDSRLGWRVTWIALCLLAIGYLLFVFQSRLEHLELSSLLLVLIVGALLLVVAFHTRFLLQVRKEHAASDESFQQMANNIQEVFWMIDAETRKILYISPAYRSITGHSCPSTPGDPSSYKELIHAEDRGQVLTRLEEATRTGLFNRRFRIRRADGEIRWVWVRGFPVRDTAGKICRLVGTAQDITDQVQAEEQVAKNLELAESARAEAEALRKATLALTQDLRMDYVLDTLLESLSELIPCESARVLLLETDTRLFLAREILSQGSVERPSNYPMTLDASDYPLLRHILECKESALLADTERQKEWKTFTGHTKVRSWLGIPLLASNQALGLLSIGSEKPNSFTEEHLRRAQLLAIPAAAAIQNARLYERAEIYGAELEKRISDLHRTQTALAQAEGDRRISEDKFQKVFRSSPIPFSITTLDEGRFLEVNAAFERRYGYTRAEVIGHTVHELRIWENASDRARMVAQLQKGGPIRNVITPLRLKSGEVRLTAYSADKIQFDGKTCILAVSEDILSLEPHQSN